MTRQPRLADRRPVPAHEWPQPPKAQFPRLKKKSSRRSDFVVAALGITLGLICALFPWYIFFNQEQFGVQAIKFGGTGTNSGRAGGGVVAERSAPLTAKDVPAANLDLLATGTCAGRPQSRARRAALSGRLHEIPHGSCRQWPRHDRGRCRPLDRPARIDIAGFQ